jgi:filamentous hemagglutinin
LHIELSKGIGENFSPLLKDNPDIIDKILHKIIHVAAGCVVGSLQRQCEAGAIGAGVGEILAETMINNNLVSQTLIDETNIKNYGKILSGIISAYAGYDVNTAANSAEIVIENNALASARSKLESAKRSCAGVGFAYGSSSCKAYLSEKYAMQPALRTALVRSNVTEFVLENLEDFVPFFGDIKGFKDATNGKEYLIAAVGILPVGDLLKAGKKTITLILKDGTEVEAVISTAGTGYKIYVPRAGKDIAEQMAQGKTIKSTTYKPNARQTVNNIKGVDKAGNNWSVDWRWF